MCDKHCLRVTETQDGFGGCSGSEVMAVDSLEAKAVLLFVFVRLSNVVNPLPANIKMGTYISLQGFLSILMKVPIA